MYKNISDSELLSCVEKSLAFEYGDYQEYQSELSHRLKTYGDDFVKLYGSDDAYSFAMSLGEHCALYLHTLIKYLCQKSGVVFEELPISKYSPSEMSFLLITEGMSIVYESSEDLQFVRDSIGCALDEFLSVGLVALDETIYGAV